MVLWPDAEPLVIAQEHLQLLRHLMGLAVGLHVLQRGVRDQRYTLEVLAIAAGNGLDVGKRVKRNMQTLLCGIRFSQLTTSLAALRADPQRVLQTVANIAERPLYRPRPRRMAHPVARPLAAHGPLTRL